MCHSPPQILNSYLIKGERPSLPSHLFYEPRSQYIANQSESAKETVSPKIGKNIEMLLWFRSIIIIKIWWINIKTEHKKLNVNIYKVTFLLNQLLIFLSLFIIYLFRRRDCKKKVSNHGRLMTIFYFTWPVDRKWKLFKIGLYYLIN